MAGLWFGGERCNLGPFGKTDRAIAFSGISLWLAVAGSLPHGLSGLLFAFVGLHGVTLYNRIHYLLSIPSVHKIS